MLRLAEAQCRLPIEILGELFELVNRIVRRATASTDRVLETVIDVIVDQGLLGLCDRFLDSLKLLCQIHTLASLLDHSDHGAQMTFGTPEAFNDLRVSPMYVWVAHKWERILGGRMTQDFRPRLEDEVSPCSTAVFCPGVRSDEAAARCAA